MHKNKYCLNLLLELLGENRESNFNFSTLETCTFDLISRYIWKIFIKWHRSAERLKFILVQRYC